MVREFGYSVHDQCKACVQVLIDAGAYEHAESVIRSSRTLIDALQEVNGTNFLCTPAGR